MCSSDLPFVKVVDLVDEEDSGLPQPVQPLRLLDDFFELLDAGRDGREADAVGAAGARQDPRQRGLAAARRAPEDEGVEAAAGDHLAQQFSRAEQMPLADELLQARRAHPLGQGDRRATLSLRGRVEEFHEKICYHNSA